MILYVTEMKFLFKRFRFAAMSAHRIIVYFFTATIL